ncbi:unnamed protein product [Spirodela intermedia]|uniref:Uncharacterized protein n=1 Tax=Spirodela intermedia TaxID=51605 RepID=A0A7I8I8Q1_SPIIN|nr:unnamed protein product [Spirodela intermedia]CAA6654035.1 unnamed protein product [Spirodela intermedia]
MHSMLYLLLLCSICVTVLSSSCTEPICVLHLH